VRANRAYELTVRRGSRLPAALAPRNALDEVEVVEIESGEVVLFWDSVPAQTGRLARGLRADLSQLDADEFLRRWSGHQTP
jgi:hypothetical protein